MDMMDVMTLRQLLVVAVAFLFDLLVSFYVVGDTSSRVILACSMVFLLASSFLLHVPLCFVPIDNPCWFARVGGQEICNFESP